jgi:hypothetical protein
MTRRSIAFLTCILLLSACAFKTHGSVRFQQYRAGHYEGSALNTTGNQRGKLVLDLYDYDPASGSVRAYSGFSDGLSGEAWLSGSIGGRGELDLAGTLSDFRMVVHGRLGADGTIKATYRLEGAAPQEGNFEVAFQRPLPAAQGQTTPGFDDLIGAWEVGGGLPAQRNPVTGEATGVSFTEARRLEIFPDGQFKHVLSHRHCEGTGISRCCSESAVLEQGKVSVEGRRLVFDIEGGGTILKDGCNPSLSRQGTVGRRSEGFEWSLKTAAGGAVLCLRQSSGESACYQKQS